MDKNELCAYIDKTYGVTGEHLFVKYPELLVFRHATNGKWFAVIMDIPAEKLGLVGGTVTVVNLKCDTRLIGTFRMEPGIFPGWHMNKAHWLSVSLDGTVENDKLKFLLDMSFTLTKGGKK